MSLQDPNSKPMGAEADTPAPSSSIGPNQDGPVSKGNPAMSTEKDGSTAETAETATDEVQPGRALQNALLAVGLCLGMFTVALDNTVISTAIPKITTEFHSLDNTGWYGSAYFLTNCALQPIFGTVYTMFSVKWTYLTALLVFEVGSVLCAAATSPAMLSAGRAVAGAGAAALFNGAMNIIGSSVPLRKRAIYIGVLGSMFSIASVVGPILGGALTEYVSWRWCFWINLPIGALTAITVTIFFKSPAKSKSTQTILERIRQLDILGTALVIGCIVCLLLALQWGGTTYAWSDSKVWGLFLGFGLLGIAFVVLQVRLGDAAILPPRIFKQRTVWAVLSSYFVLSFGLFVLVYYLPFYFQAVRMASAEGSGLRMLPLLVTITIASLVSGTVTTITGHYVPFLYSAGVLFTIGAGLCTTLKVDSYAGAWVGYQLLAGIGVGLSLQIPYVATQVVLPPEDQPIGNALVTFFASFGGALSVSVGNSIFLNQLTSELSSRISDAAVVAAIIRAGASSVVSVTPPALLPEVILSYNNAVIRVFIVAIPSGALAFILSLFTEWRTIDTKAPDGEGSTSNSTLTEEGMGKNLFS